MPEGADQRWTPPHATQGTAPVMTELREIARAEVGQFVMFPVAPDVLDRIQFRRIGGELLDPQSLALLGNKIASELAFVGGQAVPDDQQRS